MSEKVENSLAPSESYSVASNGTVTPSSEIVQSFNSIEHANAYEAYTNVLPGISARAPFGQRDYEYFRPDESLPRKYADMVKAIDEVYYKLAVVRNTVDLMSDFASQGIRVVHPVPKIQRFFESWFTKVNGIERSERFLSNIYRHGMIAINIKDGKLKKKTIQNMSKAALEDNSRASIPLEYEFIHPALIKKNKDKYVYMKPMVAGQNVPGPKEISLKEENTYISYYKKDDWQEKPIPFLLPVVKHAIMLNKLHLADSAALDGAISNIRVWKLGNLEYKIYPTEAGVNRLDSLLRANIGGGATDLIWGPDIELIESSTDLVAFLGEEKYRPHLQQIYEGLGIPASLIGTGGGTTNNFISLKIMMRRLRCGRFLLANFWQQELNKIQDAMGIAKRATIDFDHFDIGDEESERQFLLNLVDRQIISEERLHNIIGFNSELERSRIMKEEKERENNKRANKASPYHDPMFVENLEKIALQRGYMSPQQLGLVPEEGTEDETTPYDKQIKSIENRNSRQDVSKTDSSGGPGGRPPGSKDKEKRKTKQFTPSVKASFEVWAASQQKRVADLLKPAILHAFSKKNLRELTAEEIEIGETLKFGVLSNIEAYSILDDSEICALVSKNLDRRIKNEFNALSSKISNELNRSLTLDEQKQIQIIVLMEKFYNENF